MNDTAKFADQSEAIDEHAAMFGEGLGDEEIERQLGQEPIPRFDRYVLKSEGGKGGLTTNTGTPVASIAARVVEGPEGTVGRIIFGDLYLKTSRVKRDRAGNEEPRSDEEYGKARDRLKATIKRVARVFALLNPFPPTFSEDDLSSYAAQFGGPEGEGIIFIGAVSVRKATAEYDARNGIVWQSVATLDDPAKDKKGDVIPGKTALDDAREEIVKFNAKQSKKGAGRTAGSFAGVAKSVDPREALRA